MTLRLEWSSFSTVTAQDVPVEDTMQGMTEEELEDFGISSPIP